MKIQLLKKILIPILIRAFLIYSWQFIAVLINEYLYIH